MTAEILLDAEAGPNLSTLNGCGLVEEGILCFCTISTWTNCERETYGIFKLLVKYGADLNVVDRKRRTCLHHCARAGNTELMEKLLAAGADANINDKYDMIPLFDALARHNDEMVEMLLPKSNLKLLTSYGGTALHLVTLNRFNPESNKYIPKLIEWGVDPDVCSNWYGTPLTMSINFCNVDAVKILVESGCSVDVPDSAGETPLHRASGQPCKILSEKQATMCEILIQAGANVDVPGYTGLTPLMKAVKLSHLSIVRQLLQANCAATMTTTIPGYYLTAFMAEAIATNATDCATFIFGDSCSSSQDQHFFYDLSLRPEAMVNGKTVELSKPPVSLFRLCRRAVRRVLPKGSLFLCAVDRLSLPRDIKDFIAMHTLSPYS